MVHIVILISIGLIAISQFIIYSVLRDQKKQYDDNLSRISWDIKEMIRHKEEEELLKRMELNNKAMARKNKNKLKTKNEKDGRVINIIR